MKGIRPQDIKSLPSTSRRELTTKIYPHGFGSTVCVRRQVKVDDGPRLQPGDDRRIAEAIEYGAFRDALEHDYHSRQGSITLTKAANSHKPPRAKRGSKGMSFRASQRVRANALSLEERFGKSRLGFFTATVPGMSGPVDENVNQQWSRVLKNFKESVRKLLLERGLVFYYVYATEVQMQRMKTTGFPYLHIHMVFVSKKRGHKEYVVSHKEMRELWISALNSVSDGSPFWTAITDLQPVKKSVVSYLGKYLSKGAKSATEVTERGQAHNLPSEWWGSGRKEKEWVKRHTFTAGQEISQVIADWLTQDPERHFDYYSQINLKDHEGRQIRLGWVYAIKPDSLALLHGMEDRLREPRL